MPLLIPPLVHVAVGFMSPPQWTPLWPRDDLLNKIHVATDQALKPHKHAPSRLVVTRSIQFMERSD